MAKESERKKTPDSEIVNEIFQLYDNHPLQGEEYQKRALWLAFYNGHHYVGIGKDGRLQDIKESDTYYRHRSKINLTKRNADVSIAKLLKEEPNVITIPATMDHEDVQAARCAKKLSNNIFHQLDRNLHLDLYSVMLNAYNLGTGYWHIRWNPNLFVTISKGGKQAMKGDWDLTVLDDFDFLPDPTQKTFERIQWGIYVSIASIKEIESLYPDLEGKVTEINSNYVEDSRYSYGKTYYSTNEYAKKNMCMRLEYWERPSVTYPKGRYAVIINDSHLAEYKEENPHYDYGYIYCVPFIPFRWCPNSLMFHGNSAVRDQISIQKEINMLCSLIMINARANASTTLAVPKGSGIKAEHVDGNPRLIEYSPLYGATVQSLGGSPMPAYVQNHIGMLAGFQQDVSGTHEVSFGQLPERGSHMPAAALKMLMDSEAMIHAQTMRGLKYSLALSFNLILKIQKNNYKEVRYFKILGKNAQWEIEAFEESSLDGSFDLILEIGSSINSSPAAKIETALNLWDRQVPQAAEQGDPAAKKMLALLEYGDIEILNRMETLVRNWTENFINMIVKERKVPPIHIPNNPIYIDMIINRLEELIFTPEFVDYPPDTQNVILQAVQLFEQKKPPQQEQGQPEQGGQETAPPPPQDMMGQAEAMGMGGQGGLPPQGPPGAM